MGAPNYPEPEDNEPQTSVMAVACLTSLLVFIIALVVLAEALRR